MGRRGRTAGAKALRLEEGELRLRLTGHRHPNPWLWRAVHSLPPGVSFISLSVKVKEGTGLVIKPPQQGCVTTPQGTSVYRTDLSLLVYPFQPPRCAPLPTARPLNIPVPLLGTLFRCLGWWLVAQLCPTVCDPVDCSLPGSSPWYFQAILEWVSMSSSRDLPDPGIKPKAPVSPTLQVDSSPAEPSGKLCSSGVLPYPLYHCTAHSPAPDTLISWFPS